MEIAFHSFAKSEKSMQVIENKGRKFRSLHAKSEKSENLGLLGIEIWRFEANGSESEDEFRGIGSAARTRLDLVEALAFEN